MKAVWREEHSQLKERRGTNTQFSKTQRSGGLLKGGGQSRGSIEKCVKCPLQAIAQKPPEIAEAIYTYFAEHKSQSVTDQLRNPTQEESQKQPLLRAKTAPLLKGIYGHLRPHCIHNQAVIDGALALAQELDHVLRQGAAQNGSHRRELRIRLATELAHVVV